MSISLLHTITPIFDLIMAHKCKKSQYFRKLSYLHMYIFLKFWKHFLPTRLLGTARLFDLGSFSYLHVYLGTTIIPHNRVSLEISYQVFGLFANSSSLIFEIWCLEIIHFQNIEQFITKGSDVLTDLKKKKNISMYFNETEKSFSLIGCTKHDRLINNGLLSLLRAFRDLPGL